MPGPLTHSPADIVRWLLVATGHGTDPADGAAWPVFATSEPSSPDRCITVFDSTGRDDGWDQTSGERQEHHGVTIRFRAESHAVGYPKARAVAVALDQDVFQAEVAVDGALYRVAGVTRTGDVVARGKDVSSSKRSVFTVDAVVSVSAIG